MRVSDVAYEKIKMMIITARLRPGQTLVEAELMEELGMGRTPIREALNRLAWENFVKIVPRQCIMVNEISLYEVESIYQMRFALSPLESELAESDGRRFKAAERQPGSPERGDRCGRKSSFGSSIS